MFKSTTGRRLLFGICLLWLSEQTSAQQGTTEGTTVEYGVDISFPMHTGSVSQNYEGLPHNQLPSLYPTPARLHDVPIQPLGNRGHVYYEFIHGCSRHYSQKGGNPCRANEDARIAMNLRQPRSMVNYTETGFLKVKAPESVKKTLSQFWDRNQENWKPERWPGGNTFVNHWSSPTYMVNVEDSGLRGRAKGITQAVWDATQGAIEEWTGEKLTPISMYGIRVYTEGSILNPHVDRLPMVFSAVLNVAQDVDEPWPLELIGHDGIAYNVTLEPGDMLLYESHSIIHGRPFALQGRYLANIFAHFEPVGHSMDHHGYDPGTASEKLYQRGGHETADHPAFPEYILPDSDEEHYLEHELHLRRETKKESGFLARKYAASRKTDDFIELVEDNNSLVNAEDANGWKPLHEGARSGNLDIVKYLVERGADINERTHEGTGGTPLFFAMEVHGKDSAVYKYLEEAGGISLGPMDV